MTAQGEEVPPRGYGNYSLSDDGMQSRGMLAYTEPTLSLVTLFPPEERTFSSEEILLKWYELYHMAGPEELFHGFYTKTGGIRNLRLLERKTNQELVEERRKSVQDLKESVVRTELVAEKLFQGTVNLIETHDIFTVHQQIFGTDSVARVDNPFIAGAARQFEVDEAVLVEVIERNADRLFHRPVVDSDVLEELRWLQTKTQSLTAPQLVMMMALDIPYIVSPLSVPDGVRMSVDHIDFRERFDQIMAVLRTPRVLGELIQAEDWWEQRSVIQMRVEVHSSVTVSDRFTAMRDLPYATLNDFTLPLLDGGFEEAQFASRRQETRVIDGYRDQGWPERYLARIVERLFSVFGAVIPTRDMVYLNPYIRGGGAAAEQYHVEWIRQFAERRLTEQVLRYVIDGKEKVFRDPLEAYEFSLMQIDGSITVENLSKLADDLAAVSVDGEAELRQLRETRADVLSTG